MAETVGTETWTHYEVQRQDRSGKWHHFTSRLSSRDAVEAARLRRRESDEPVRVVRRVKRVTLK